MILVCGEALFDVFATAATATGMQMDARIGGSPLNVAIGLARLGQPVAFLGGISRGFMGQRLLKAIREEGVETVCLHHSDAPTTLSLIGLSEQGVPSYSFYNEGCADRLLPQVALELVPANVQAIHVGSYAMVVDPVAQTQRALIEREYRRCVIAYDPNVRLNVEPNRQKWRDTLAWMALRTHILKVSEEDLGLLYPGMSAATLAQQWLSRGVSVVVVTRGGDGAQAWCADGQSLTLPPVPVTVLDTVGAGDTFQAALLCALAEQGHLQVDGLRRLPASVWQTVLTFAGQAAAVTCSRRGADLPYRDQLA